MRLLFTTVILLSGLAHAGEPLSKEEWAIEGAFLVVGLIDYGQTRNIKRHGHLEEKNPLLGKAPNDEQIRNYFLAAGLAHLGITYLLPKEYRPYWQWGTLILELGYVAHNHQIGLKVDF
jgi:hypothetical protein